MCTLSCEKGLIDSYRACSPMTYHSVSKRGRLGWTVARGDCKCRHIYVGSKYSKYSQLWQSGQIIPHKDFLRICSLIKFNT